jgi:hypothetical protein
MNSICRLAVIFGLTMLVVLSKPGTAGADDWNLKTSFSVNHAVEVPGAVLEPNTRYIISRMDFLGDRNVVQIKNEDESRVIATFMTVDDRLQDPVEKTKFEFMEAPKGQPLPVRAWFYPGRATGLEFLYPKEQAERFIAYGNGNVGVAEQTASAGNLPLEEPASTPVIVEQQAALAVPELPQVASEPAVPPPAPGDSDVNKVPPAIERTKPDLPEIVTPEVTQETAEAPVPEQLPDALPATAGEGTWLALAAALSLGLGLGVRRLSTSAHD